MTYHKYPALFLAPLIMEDAAALLYFKEIGQSLHFVYKQCEKLARYSAKIIRAENKQFALVLNKENSNNIPATVVKIKNDDALSVEKALKTALLGQIQGNPDGMSGKDVLTQTEADHVFVEDAPFSTRLQIGGFLKTTLLDFPGKVAATVFLSGCNFRCPYCHNSGLLDLPELDEIQEADVMEHLSKRKGILEGICVSGGEPTLQAWPLIRFLRQVKKGGYPVKLDTNGSKPRVLRYLIENSLVDCVAMDIKSEPIKYHTVSGNSCFRDVVDSIFLLKDGKIPYEFRTTAVKGIHTAEDFLHIGEAIRGCSNYYIQNYRPSQDVLAPEGLAAFSLEELNAFTEILKPYVNHVQVRGV